MRRFKRYFYSFIHLIFVSGFLYAFYHFINTPKSIFLNRRLWAYESWIILSFYFLFIYLILMEKEVKIGPVVKGKFKKLKQVLLVNLLLLIFPWGMFLLLAPGYLLDLLHLNTFYWRILGVFSLLGAFIYYFPYRFYQNKFTYYILTFGFIDNLLAGTTVVALFILKKISLLVFSTSPLLFYFSIFFLEQAKNYKNFHR